jgi:hypothetical protein
MVFDFPVSDGYLPDEEMLQLSAGEKYVVHLKKINNSLGLNVTVSLNVHYASPLFVEKIVSFPSWNNLELSWFQGGVNTSVKNGGIFVKSLAERGAAERNGNIAIGSL